MTPEVIRRRRIVRLLRLFAPSGKEHPSLTKADRLRISRPLEVNYWRLDDRARRLLDVRFGLDGLPSWSATRIARVTGRKTREIELFIWEIRLELTPVILAVELGPPPPHRKASRSVRQLPVKRRPRAAALRN